MAADPARDRFYIGASAAFTLLMLWFALHYLRKRLRRQESP